MTGPAAMLFAAVVALVLGVLRPDLVHPDLPVVAGFVALSSLVVLGGAWALGQGRARAHRPHLRPGFWPKRPASRPTSRPRWGGHKPLNWVVIDGSNVLFWNNRVPSLDTVAAVVRRVQAEGKEPLVWFDANVGYKVGDVWLGPWELSRALGLPKKRVFVAEKGQPADPSVLAEAQARGGRIVTNDRYRDWVDQHPVLSRPGLLIRGGFRDGALWLESDAVVAEMAA